MKYIDKLDVYDDTYLIGYSKVIGNYRSVFEDMIDMQDSVPVDIFRKSCITLINRFNKDIKIASKNLKKNVKIARINNKRFNKEQIKELKKQINSKKEGFFKRLINSFTRKKKEKIKETSSVSKDNL